MDRPAHRFEGRERHFRPGTPSDGSRAVPQLDDTGANTQSKARVNQPYLELRADIVRRRDRRADSKRPDARPVSTYTAPDANSSARGESGRAREPRSSRSDVPSGNRRATRALASVSIQSPARTTSERERV